MSPTAAVAFPDGAGLITMSSLISDRARAISEEVIVERSCIHT